MAVYLTSDLHLGHKAICKYRPKFTSQQEHDEYMLSLFDSLTKRDLVFILGDFLFDGPHYNKYIQRLKALPCRIKLVLGNHDSMRLIKEDWIEHLNPLTNYKGFWLSHCPIHPDELRNRTGCVHGHLHSESVTLNKEKDSRYFNVNIEDNNYQLVSLDTIKNYFKENTC